ncbi:MAG: DMT family transporter [Burkholderia sp.]|jgi:drug/metabolite transporter (DMT)-like permease|uniref:DMT family transporter n=3 Tax=Burkholderiaceae TaxID=119060 RepID=UPI00158C1B22|nr:MULTISPECIES: DMT family transporter [Burkholderia]MBY8610053.1 DMT family transporter [Burkholderia arboris]MCA3780579.1 DMT family transporter [Burkholderia sp.]MCA3797671.1 DMT family transporter [Burkholderia sp.]MCA3806602.1 DMT family transporter [Burkholderia sp.]MCA3807574.1 DMT family transporter [Burkholderia sp.]
MNEKERLTGIGYGLLAAIIWGGFPVVTRLGVTHSALDAYDIAFIRFAVSGTLLLPVLLHRGLGTLRPASVALMVTGAGAPYILTVAAALSRAPVGYFALTPGSMIAFTAILGRQVAHERLTAAQVAGIVAILAGIALTASDALRGAIGLPALGLFMLGGLLWAIYNVTTKRAAAGALHATAVVSVGSAVLYCPLYLAMRGGAVLHAPVAAIATQAIYQGVLMSVLALYCFSRAVVALGPAIGATFAALMPLLATLEALLLLGERPHAPALAGIAIVTAGMAASLASRWRTGERPDIRRPNRAAQS